MARRASQTRPGPEVLFINRAVIGSGRRLAVLGSNFDPNNDRRDVLNYALGELCIRWSNCFTSIACVPLDCVMSKRAFSAVAWGTPPFDALYNAAVIIDYKY